MQPNLIGTDEAKQIAPNTLRQSLQLCGCDLLTGKDHVDEYRRIVTPVDADMMIDSFHERIARVLRSQAIDAIGYFLAGSRFGENGSHRDSLYPAYRAAGESVPAVQPVNPRGNRTTAGLRGVSPAVHPAQTRTKTRIP